MSHETRLSIMSRSLLRARIVGVVCATIIFGCHGEPTAPGEIDYVRVMPDWVAEDAATALDPVSGQFRLPDPNPKYTSLLSAETLAVAVARLLGNPNTIGNAALMAQQDRGGPIDFNNLRLCHRPIYSVGPFGDLPPPVPDALRRAWASQWAIALCGKDGKAQLSVGIPDDPMRTQVENGEIVFPPGFYLSTTGVPFRYPFGLPLTPEEAVAAVVERTGRRVVRIPVAFNQHDDRGVGQLPLCASWIIHLDGPINVRSEATGNTREVTELFIRHAPACFSDAVAFYVASDDQPQHRWIAISSAGDSAEVSLTGPVVFERVTVER